MIEANRERRQQVAHVRCERRIATRGILVRVQCRGEAAEVVNGLRIRHRGDRGAANVPMRGHGEDGRRPG